MPSSRFSISCESFRAPKERKEVKGNRDLSLSLERAAQRAYLLMSDARAEPQCLSTYLLSKFR